MKLDDMSVGQGSKPESTNTRLKEVKATPEGTRPLGVKCEKTPANALPKRDHSHVSKNKYMQFRQPPNRMHLDELEMLH